MPYENPYTPPTLTGFNSAPPSDDGQRTASNVVRWATHLAKIGNPLKTYAQAINSAVLSAFNLLPSRLNPLTEAESLAGVIPTNYQYEPRNVPRFGNNTSPGTTDMTTAAQAAIDSLNTSGGEVKFSPLRHIVSDADADSRCLVVTYATKIVGEGPFYTAIEPASGVGSSVNTLVFAPSTSFAADFSSIERIMVGNPTTGTRAGNHGIFLSTQDAGQYLPKFTIRDAYVGQGSGQGVYHLNDAVDNVNGGMYGALFENSAIKGGVKLENTGDSNVVRNNILTGTGIGVDAALISGASLLSVHDNNITNDNGSFRLDSGHRFYFGKNNCENYNAGANANNNSAVVNIAGAVGTINGGIVEANLISKFGSSDATYNLRLNNVNGTVVRDNVFLSGTASSTAIVIASGNNVRIGPNVYNSNISTKVSDSGTGTMGVVKTASLQNSWVVFAAGDIAPGYIKSPGDGIVHVWASIKDGTTADGTLLFTLAAGFRPSALVRAPAHSLTGATRSMGLVTVESDGSVRCYGAQADMFAFNLTFPADGLADGVSAE